MGARFNMERKKVASGNTRFRQHEEHESNIDVERLHGERPRGATWECSSMEIYSVGL